MAGRSPLTRRFAWGCWGCLIFMRLGPNCCALLLITALFVPILAVAAESQESTKAFYQSPGTKKMAALLEKIYLEQPWQTDPNKSEERVQRLQADLAAKPSLRDELKMREALAENLLRAGDSAGAVKQLEKIRNLASENGIVLAPFFEKQIRDTLAIAYLRLGEQENCVQYHGQESCVFPIHGSGVHKLQRGAQGAVRELTTALEKDSSDLKSRWLLNIAYMTLGRYPADVPARWLIPSSRFDSEYDLGKFLDIAPSVGLAVTGHSGGAILEDFDGDGFSGCDYVRRLWPSPERPRHCFRGHRQ